MARLFHFIYQHEEFDVSETRKTVFEDEELKVLQRAFDEACVALELCREDFALREQLAVVIFDIAQTGGCDEAILKTRAIRQFGRLRARSFDPLKRIEPAIFAQFLNRRRSLRRER